jgi:hypothetical protein
MPQASDGIPRQRAWNGDQQGLEHMRTALDQQIPGHDANKDGDTLGEGKLCWS